MCKAWPPFLAVTSKKVILASDGRQHTLHQSDVMLYGLTWDMKHIYVSTRHDPEEERASSILKFDCNMSLVEPLTIDWLGSDVHQLLAWKGQLYICNTGYSNLIIHDLARGGQIEVRWTHEDVHFNSIWRHGNAFYVLEHLHNNTPKTILVFNDSWRKIAMLPVHTGKQLRKTGFGVHDIYVTGGTCITLGPYSIFKVDLDDDKASTTEQRLSNVIPGNHYLRGLAALPDKRLLIGVSNLTPNTHRGDGHAKVLMVDRELNVLEELVLKDVGQICTIRLLEGDLAHHSLPCPYQPKS